MGGLAFGDGRGVGSVVGDDCADSGSGPSPAIPVMDSWQADYALYERLRAVHVDGPDDNEQVFDLRPHECQRMDDEWYETFRDAEPTGDEG